jgi:small-conductance mechanosensitive channel
VDPTLKDIFTILGTLLACYLTFRASTRATRVSQQQANIAQQAADEARAKRMRDDLEAAEGEVVKLRRQVAVLTKEAENTAADLIYLRRTIWRSGMTIERLREFVGPESPPQNGRSNI